MAAQEREGLGVCPRTGQECVGFRCKGPVAEELVYEINGKRQHTDVIQKCGRITLKQTPAQRIYEQLRRYDWDE